MKIIELLKSNDVENVKLGIELLKSYENYDSIKFFKSPPTYYIVETIENLVEYTISRLNYTFCEYYGRKLIETLIYHNIDI